MKEILETILANLVENKEAIQINEKQEGQEIVFEVKVAESDMGRVIGKQGKIARVYKKYYEGSCSKRT